MRRAHLCIPLAVAVAIAGCGETKIDGRKAEKLIRELVTKDVGARVASVACRRGSRRRRARRSNAPCAARTARAETSS